MVEINFLERVTGHILRDEIGKYNCRNELQVLTVGEEIAARKKE